jgi:hypothetical protein
MLPNVKHRDLERIRSGELVRVTKDEWIKPLTQDVCNATGLGADVYEVGSKGRSDLYGIFPELGLFDGLTYNVAQDFLIVVGGSHHYLIKWAMFGFSEASTTPTVRCSYLHNLNYDGRSYYLFDNCKKTKVRNIKFDRSFLSYPHICFATFRPLSPYLLKPIVKDLIARGAVPQQHLYSAISHTDLLTPQLKHAFATLKGVKSYSERLLSEAIVNAQKGITP